jgi:hypothetical protein
MAKAWGCPNAVVGSTSGNPSVGNRAEASTDTLILLRIVAYVWHLTQQSVKLAPRGVTHEAQYRDMQGHSFSKMWCRLIIPYPKCLGSEVSRISDFCFFFFFGFWNTCIS